MHPNAQTLQRFYTAFAQLDHATMAACYAPDAQFDDEAFSLKGRDQIGGMWRMLCTASQKPEARSPVAVEAGVQRHRGRRARRPRALGGRLFFQRHQAHRAQHRGRQLHLYARGADCHAPRPLQFLGLGAAGVGRAGVAAGLVAIAQAQGAQHGGGEFEEVFGAGVMERALW